MRIVLVCNSDTDVAPSSGYDAREQALAVGQHLLRDYGSGVIAALFTSPAVRAQVTAALIAAEIGGCEVETLDVLGETPSSLEATAERLTEASDRAWPWIEAMKDTLAQDAVVVAVTHELTLRALVCRAIAIAPENALRFELAPASLTTLEFRFQPQQRTLLASLNEICHLEAV